MATTIYGGRWKTSRRVFAGGLVADCGKYLADWPPPFPMIAQNLPDDARELDYIIALPNPDETADDVIDGSYPTVFFHMRMRRSGTDILINDFGIQQSGSASGTDLPHGAHLYVGFYPTSREKPIPHPSLPADDVVPQDWTITARGWAREKSFWSKWQRPAEDSLVDISPVGGLGGVYADYGTTQPDPSCDKDTDLAAVLAELHDTALGQNPGYYSDTAQSYTDRVPIGANYYVFAQKQASSPGSNNWDWVNAVFSIGEEMIRFEAPETTTPGYDRSVFDNLVEGVDYGTNPATGQLVQYDRDPSFVRWEDVDVEFVYHWHAAFKGPYVSGLPMYYCENYREPHARWSVVAGDLVDLTTRQTQFQPYGAGTEVAAWDGPKPDPAYAPEADVTVFFTDPVTEHVSGTDTVTFQLSQLGQRRSWTLVSQLDYMLDPEPFTDFTVQDYPGFDNSGPEGSWYGERKMLNFFINTHFGNWWDYDTGWHQSTIFARYKQPHWRYWKLGKLIPRIGYIADSSPKNRDVVWV